MNYYTGQLIKWTWLLVYVRQSESAVQQWAAGCRQRSAADPTRPNCNEARLIYGAYRFIRIHEDG